MIFKCLSVLLLCFCSTAWAKSPDSLKVAVSQYPIVGNQSLEAILSKVESAAKAARQGGAELLVLPELLTLDHWPKPTKRTDAEIVELVATKITPGYLNRLKELSTKYQLYLVGGSTPRRTSRGIVNAAPLVRPSGKIQFHEKVHLTAWERDHGFVKGNKASVFESPWGRISVLICYDAEFPDLSVELMKQRPTLIVVPSMTESPAGAQRVRWSVQARTVEQTAYAVIATTMGETWKDWHHYGQAVVLGPSLPDFQGVIVEAKPTDNLIFATLDLKKLQSARQSSKWQPALDLKRRLN